MSARPPAWNRQELILALDLYFQVGAADYRSSKRVQELSRLIREMHQGQPYLVDSRFRSASSVSRKLKNIAWIDPVNTRGTAQSHGSAVDDEIWDEFADDRDRLSREAATIREWIGEGMPSPSPSTGLSSEIEATLDVADQQAGKRRSGQGFGLSPAARQAVERHLMDRAMHYFADLGWSDIVDVSRSRCFDLLCQRDDEELRVEVKRTTSPGDRILLTRNEVTHARRVFPRVALYVLANVQLVMLGSTLVEAREGTEIVRHPWDIGSGQLQPIAYQYELGSSS